jgi:hypothetical protein
MPPQEEIENLERLLDELLSGVQEILQSGEFLSDELQGMIAEELQWLISRIDELRNQEGAAPTPSPPITPPQQGSSNVAGTAYNDKTGDLTVQFLGKHPNRQGPIYKYPQTSPEVAELVQSGAIPARTDGSNAWGKWWKGKVPSAGASVFTLLKSRNAPFQRLS